MSQKTWIKRTELSIVFGIVGFILICISISVAFNNTNSGLAIVLAIIACSLFLAATILSVGDSIINSLKQTRDKERQNSWVGFKRKQ